MSSITNDIWILLDSVASLREDLQTPNVIGPRVIKLNFGNHEELATAHSSSNKGRCLRNTGAMIYYGYGKATACDDT